MPGAALLYHTLSTMFSLITGTEKVEEASD
jgi:hypothetical protein